MVNPVTSLASNRSKRKNLAGTVMRFAWWLLEVMERLCGPFRNLLLTASALTTYVFSQFMTNCNRYFEVLNQVFDEKTQKTKWFCWRLKSRCCEIVWDCSMWFIEKYWRAVLVQIVKILRMIFISKLLILFTKKEAVLQNESIRSAEKCAALFLANFYHDLSCHEYVHEKKQARKKEHKWTRTFNNKIRNSRKSVTCCRFTSNLHDFRIQDFSHHFEFTCSVFSHIARSISNHSMLSFQVFFKKNSSITIIHRHQIVLFVRHLKSTIHIHSTIHKVFI